MKLVLLKPCGFLITDKPLLIRTHLDSSISICLYDLHRGCAAIDNYLKDIPPTGYKESDIGKYGFIATEHIINALMAGNRRAGDYVAQVFGGAVLEDGTNKIIARKNI
jgi:chemotaxis receptor (MCP) glutamine deamidase CheD